jgi:hypothetical protein
MQVDDEILFGRVVDEMNAPNEAEMTPADFQLHGATLRSLARWYPEEGRVRRSLVDWDRMALALPVS